MVFFEQRVVLPREAKLFVYLLTLALLLLAGALVFFGVMAHRLGKVLHGHGEVTREGYALKKRKLEGKKEGWDKRGD
ncbi:hypothetical protein P154DRAFT_520593 [Amniculicola lignicola CBS 123094]|uniref:Uncharacterized protein n=1 Tax=Amniculicola lignicola CBS 123094 TaxID=1392246 RepID=A0A6A5WM89_9PLEO|nr:hypothetical protein P154DRAFT_520593 [Amniculicola lignicola CBS 123094]